MAESVSDPNVPDSCEQLREIADILAEGYLRLRRMRESSSGRAGPFEEKYPQDGPVKRLDSFGHRSDE